MKKYYCDSESLVSERPRKRKEDLQAPEKEGGQRHFAVFSVAAVVVCVITHTNEV